MTGRTVLVLPGWYPTAREPLSGPFVRDHARAATLCGYDVVVLVDEGPLSGSRRLFRLSWREEKELTVVGFAARPHWGRVTFLLAVLLVTQRLAREGRAVALLHAHIHWRAWPAVMAGTLLRRPVVVSEHSSAWPRRLLSKGQLRRARIAFRRAAIVCPVSESLRLAIESYGVRARFRVVPNAVDTRIFRAAATPAPGTPTKLINVALHVDVKGLDILLRAFADALKRRPDLTLDMVGDGPLTPELKQLAASLGIAHHVHFVGRAAPLNIAEMLRKSDLFVLSSLSENLPLAVLEALCCGLPVAATDVGAVPEVVGNDGVFASAGDVEELAAAIDEILRDYPRFDPGDIAARAAARYSLEAIGKKWDEIYRSL